MSGSMSVVSGRQAGASSYGGAGQTNNNKAHLATAYQELGKELSSEKIKVVGGYTVGRMIAEGSFGSVHIAIHRLTGTRCAIKKVPKTLTSHITREIHHHRRLHHMNIVQLYELIATETHIWLVQELCSGGELFDYLVERGRMLEGEARRLFGELTVAVGYMHKDGVVHRDLKLENILLDGELKIKLCDLGFAREWQRGKLMETYCGTTGYASPEMLSGRKYLGVETDIWSMGIILYTLLCGGLPFDDDDERVMKDLILKGEYDEPEWLSDEAKSLIRLLLKQNPSERPSIENILKHPWFRKTIVDHIPGHHSIPPSPNPHISPSHPTHPHFYEPWEPSHTEILSLPPSIAEHPITNSPMANIGPASVPDSNSEPSTETSFDFSEQKGSASGVTTPTTAEDESEGGMKRIHSGEFSQTEKALELLHSNTSQTTIRRESLPMESPTPAKGRLSSSVQTKPSLETTVEGQNETDEEPHQPVHRESSITFDDHSLHLPVAQTSRTPSRTKRRSVSSTLSLERKVSHHSANGNLQAYPPEDYISMLKAERPNLFSTPSEKSLLNSLNDLGFDIGQLMHSVETDACDVSAAMWWIMRAKQVERGDTDEVVAARQASAAKKREKLASYAREERRKLRESNSKEPSRDPSPEHGAKAVVAFTEEAKLTKAYHLGPPLLSPPTNLSDSALSSISDDRSVPIVKTPEKHPPSTPIRDLSASKSSEHLVSPDSSPRSGKTRSPSMSMLQRATSAFLGKSEEKEKHEEHKEKEGRTSPTKLHKAHPPKKGVVNSESENTLTTIASPARLQEQNAEAGPSKQLKSPSVAMAPGPSTSSTVSTISTLDAKKRDNKWASSWTNFTKFFNPDGSRKRRRDGNPLTLADGKHPTIILSRGMAARVPHVHRVITAGSVSRKTSIDGRPPLYSRRSSSVNSRRSSATSIQMPTDLLARINSHDSIGANRKASIRSHGSQTPTSDRETGTHFESRPGSSHSARRRDSARSSISRDFRSPSIASEASLRYGRTPASPLHNYQRRAPGGTASTRVRHIKVIPEASVLRSDSYPSSIRSNASSRASSAEGRRDDSDYDTGASGREDHPARRHQRSKDSGKRRSSDVPESLAKQIHRRSSPLINPPHVSHHHPHSHSSSHTSGHHYEYERRRSSLKPPEPKQKAPLRDVFQQKEEEWIDEDDWYDGKTGKYSGGLGQGRNTSNAGVMWMSGARVGAGTSAKKRGGAESPKGTIIKDKEVVGMGMMVGGERFPSNSNNHGNNHGGPQGNNSGSQAGRRGIPANRGAPAVIEEEEEEE